MRVSGSAFSGAASRIACRAWRQSPNPDWRIRQVMNGLVASRRPRTVMVTVGKRRPERYDYRVPAAPGQEWQAGALSAQRKGTGSPEGASACVAR